MNSRRRFLKLLGLGAAAITLAPSTMLERELSALPTGLLLCYPGSQVPQGWLACDGRQITKSRYPELFSLLGSVYNQAPTGQQHFQLPLLKGMIIKT